MNVRLSTKLGEGHWSSKTKSGKIKQRVKKEQSGNKVSR